jgi:hypothetical protein
MRTRKPGARVRPSNPRILTELLFVALGLVMFLEGCGEQPTSGRTSSGSRKEPTTVSQLSPVPTATTPAQRPAGQRSRPQKHCTSTLRITVATDRTVYRLGERVLLTIAARNTSDSPCSVPTGNCIPQVRITDEAGAEIWNRATSQVLCMFGVPRHLGAREAATETIDWNARRCSGRAPADCSSAALSPGIYTVYARWQTVDEAVAHFRVTP